MNIMSLWALTFLLGVSLGLFLKSKSWTTPKLILLGALFVFDINVLLSVANQCPK